MISSLSNSFFTVRNGPQWSEFEEYPLVPHTSVQHQKPLTSTRKPPQFNTPQFNTVFFLVNLGVCWTDGFLVWNWEVCLTEEGVEIKAYLCWSERFLVLNWRVFGVELRDWGWKGSPSWCWTDVLYWGDFSIKSYTLLYWQFYEKQRIP